MLTWQSAEVVTEVDYSTKLQRVLSWVSDTGRTHCEKAIKNESALQAYSVFTTQEIGLSCQKPDNRPPPKHPAWDLCGHISRRKLPKVAF